LLEDCCKDWEIIWYGGYCGIDTEPKWRQFTWSFKVSW
jgi:hypothetical protein